MILYDFLTGKSNQECFANFTTRFGEKSAVKSIVTKWHGEFQFEQQTLEENNRCGRLVKAVTVENVVKAKSLIKEDPGITHEEIQDEPGILSGSMNNSLHNYLSV